MMGESTELSQDLHNRIFAKHNHSIAYRRISKLLYVPVSTVGAKIRKWKADHFTISLPRPGAPRKISDRSLKNNQRSCPRDKDHLWRPASGSRYHCLKENSKSCTPPPWPVCTPTTQDSITEKKHVEALLKFFAQHLDKPVKYCENVVWSDDSKIQLFGCHNTHCI